MLYLKTLGQLCLRASGPDGPPLLANSKPLAMVAVLATTPDHTARRDYLAELLWPGTGSTRARRSLRQALFYLSKRLDEPLILADDFTLTLDVDHIDVDIWRFQRALERADYAGVVELYAGPFVPGLERKAGAELEHWIETQDEQLRAGLEVAYDRLIRRSLEKGDAESAVECARKYVDLNPLNERAQLALVRSLKAANDRVGALQTYRSYRTLLREALDGEPSQELARAIAGVRAEAMKEPVTRSLKSARRRARRPGLRWIFVAAVAGAVMTAGAFAAVLTVRDSGPDDPDHPLIGLSGDFFVRVRRSRGDELARAIYRDMQLRVMPTDFGPEALPSPDRSRVVEMSRAIDGWNLALRGVRGQTAALTERSDDETPRGWSPDGRYILYREGGGVRDGRDYTHRLMTYDVETGEQRVPRVSRKSSSSMPTAPTSSTCRVTMRWTWSRFGRRTDGTWLLLPTGWATRTSSSSTPTERIFAR